MTSTPCSRPAAVIVYGEDPSTPYSALACPSTLYQAIRLATPARVLLRRRARRHAAERFRIGVRCVPDVEALSAAVDRARDGVEWEFDAAWEALA